jgi:D-arabinose 1-dehydrogenase-like Zn-dependent alcohol dehydrogenase
MKSYVVTEFGTPLQAVETPTPKPQGTEVLLKTLAAGVCHSDLHIWDGYYDLGGGKKIALKENGIAPPITLGHEIAGEIVATGPDAVGVKLGQSYVAYPWIGCGQCPACRQGREQLCIDPRTLGIRRPGGYADYVLVPHPSYLYPLGKLTPSQAAPYACSGLTAYATLKRVGEAVYRNQPILILGAGGLGLMCLRLLQALGGHGAIVAEIDPAKRQAALDAGALAAIDPKAEKPKRLIADAAKAPVAAAIDFVGSAETARLGTDSIARGGRYIIVGLFGGELTLALPLLPIRAISIEGMLVGTLAEFREVMDLVAAGKVVAVPLQERRLDQADAALRELKAGHILGRAILRP